MISGFSPQYIGVIAILLLFVVSCTADALPRTTDRTNGLDEYCRPAAKVNQVECAYKIRACAAIGVALKWTGRGCRTNANHGKFLGDGKLVAVRACI